MAVPSTSPGRRTLAYLDAIEKEGGKAGRWALLKIAGTEAALNLWLSEFFLKDGYLKETTDDHGSKTYSKTESGELLHRMLRDGKHVKILNSVLRHLSGKRLKR